MFSESITQRFWSKVAIAGPDECWEWKGGRTVRKGTPTYGSFWVNGRNVPAHRFAWEIVNGSISPELEACHTCDNPPCCNPNHVYAGTPRQNIADRERRGRGKHRENLQVKKGEENGRSKLTEDNVRVIRRMISEGEPQNIIANLFHITPPLVYQIKTGKIWRHIL